MNEKKHTFLNLIGHQVKDLNIPADMILNWDQTPINLIPVGNWTMAKTNSSKIAIAGQNDKRNITAVLTVSLDGRFLPMQLIYKGKTARSLPQYKFPESFSVTANDNHWSTEDTMKMFVNEIIKPYLEERRQHHQNPNLSGLLIFDYFRGQTTESFLELLSSLNVQVVLVPKNMTDLLQPLDISVNKPVKNFLKSKYQDWYADKLMELEREGELTHTSINALISKTTTLRELSAKWTVELYNFFQSPPQVRIIKNGFSHCGITAICVSGPQPDDPFSD